MAKVSLEGGVVSWGRDWDEETSDLHSGQPFPTCDLSFSICDRGVRDLCVPLKLISLLWEGRRDHRREPILAMRERKGERTKKRI